MIRVRRIVAKDKEMFFYISDGIMAIVNNDYYHGKEAGKPSKEYVTANDVVDFVCDALDFTLYPGNHIIIDNEFFKKYFDGLYVSDLPSKYGKNCIVRTNIVRDYLFQQEMIVEKIKADAYFGTDIEPKSERGYNRDFGQ